MSRVYYIDRDKLETEPLLPVEHPKVFDMVTVMEVKPCWYCHESKGFVDGYPCPVCKDGWVFA